MNRTTKRASLLVLLAAAAFLPALANGPLEDDTPLLHDRLFAVRSWADLPSLLTQSYWGNLADSGLWRPFALITLAVERLLFGHHLWAFRVVNIGAHCACTLMTWRLAGRLLGGGEVRWKSAWLAAAVFAVHPIHAEAVATVYGQPEVLAAVAALGVVLLATPVGVVRFRAARQVSVVVVTLIAFGFKETTLLLPLVIVALRWLTAGLSAADAVPFLAWAVYLPLRRAILGSDWTPPVTVVDDGIIGRAVTAVVAVGQDLKLLVLPWRQTIYYGHLRDRIAAGGGMEMLWLLIAAWAGRWLWRSRGNGGRASLICLAAFLLPVANVLPIGVLVAERTLYLPSVAVVIAGAAVFQRLRVATASALAAGLVTVGMALCWTVLAQWRDARTAWEVSLTDHPTAARTAAEVVLLRLADPAFSDTAADRAQLHRLLDDARRRVPDSPRVAAASAALADHERRPRRSLP